MCTPYLLEFPVEFSRSESVKLSEISSEQEHQAAVVNIQRIMVAVHLCNGKIIARYDNTRTCIKHAAGLNYTVFYSTGLLQGKLMLLVFM